RQPIVIAFRPPIFDSHVLVLDKPFLFQPLPERAQTDRVRDTRCTADKTNRRHGGLLPARRERPRCRRTYKCNELPPSHSITSSARASSDGGTVRPRALAVLRLITSSNLAGC